jgi:Uma2 family endonuclease
MWLGSGWRDGVESEERTLRNVIDGHSLQEVDSDVMRSTPWSALPVSDCPQSTVPPNLPTSPVMPATRTRRPSRFVFDRIGWADYTRMLRICDRQGLRTTYIAGRLEVMSPSFEHEFLSRILARMVEVCAEETGVDYACGGGATLRRKLQRRGLEPDDCFWIASVSAIDGSLNLDLETDPPPDLVIEVEITNPILDRIEVYSALGIPEIWRRSRTEFEVLGLDETGRYTRRERSLSFPWLPATEIAAAISRFNGPRRMEFLREWNEVVRGLVPSRGD